jgi:hypothetical protein
MSISYRRVVGVLAVSLALSIFVSMHIASADTIIENGGTYIANQTVVNSKPNADSGNGGGQSLISDIVNALFSQFIALITTIVGIGVGAIVAWLRKHGIPVTTEQEKMFKDIMTKRIETLARNTWDSLRKDPTLVDKYWDELSAGHIPQKFQDDLRKEALGFALDLKKNREFQGFAKKITEKGMENLLKTIRTDLKTDYQIRMLDVLPKIASIAVESAFDENIKTPKEWVEESFAKMKPLLMSAGALDTETNLKILLMAEINKKIKEGWLRSSP